MRKRPVKATMTSPSTGSDPRVEALKILTGRDHSVHQLKQKLQRRGFDEEQIGDACDYCERCGYLNDRRYALERARMLMRTGRGVGTKVLVDLRRHGIDGELAEIALGQANEEIDSRKLLGEQIERRFPNHAEHRNDVKLKRRIVGYFQRRGHRLDDIFDVLKNSLWE
ncbi:MAG: recombinase RecX [Desulfuromonas sp.]|nr:MAG: recombinase RecX [Desulfuromonas sp.]